MKLNIIVAAATAAAALGAASSASALIITTQVGNALPTGFSLITDFNSVGGTGPNGEQKGGTIVDVAAGFTFDQNTPALSYTRDGVAGLASGLSAPPPANHLVEDAFYETVQGGGSATLTSLRGLRKFSFYMGSPDSTGSIGFANTLSFTFFTAGGPINLSGTQVWGGLDVQPGDGNQLFGTTVIYDFEGALVHKVVFGATGNSFEFDKLAGVVPEPGTWALMIAGFGGAGAMLRRRRSAVA